MKTFQFTTSQHRHWSDVVIYRIVKNTPVKLGSLEVPGGFLRQGPIERTQAVVKWLKSNGHIPDFTLEQHDYDLGVQKAGIARVFAL